MWTSTFYGGYDYWLLYHKVTFDGPNRLIRINYGETYLDVESNLYSDWKEWSLLRDNMKYPQAMSSIGGEPLGGGQYVGGTFFLENGWRIKPWEGTFHLEVVGNLYTRESGQSPFVTTDGDWGVSITNRVSTLVFTVETPASSSAITLDPYQIAQAVWQHATTGSFTADTFGDQVYRKLLTLAQYMATK